jgi:uncharacterized protein YkwD
MSITLNTLVYNQDSFVSPSKVAYTGPDHSFTTKDLLTLARTAPKPTATFAGVARSEVKRTKTVTLADGSTADAIVTVSCSLPVGMTQADADALRDDVGDFTISADAGTLFWNHDLTY